MTTRKIAIDVPESVLLAEKTDERAFARELRMLAAVKLYELGVFLLAGLRSLPGWRAWNFC